MKMLSKFIGVIMQKLRDVNQISGKCDVHKSALLSKSIFSGTIEIKERSSVFDTVIKGKVTIGVLSAIESSSLNGAEISISDYCKIYNCNIVGQVAIGRNTSLWGPNIDLVSRPEYGISIGKYCSIARNVSMQTFNHNIKKATTYFIGKNFYNEKWHNEEVSKGGIVIGNDVWIGTHSVILGGVNIGNGAVVAANSLVNKDVPPYAIVGGSPAKVIGYRFDEVIVAKLLELEWWDWNDEQLLANKHFFEEELSLATIINLLDS
jgi:virginiamycin A acetyltransferase